MAEYGAAISLSQALSSDDEESEHSPRPVSYATGSSSKSKVMIIASGGGGEAGSGVESSKKPRGRPPGSKNKPKPPIVITRDSEAAMKPVLLEIAAGSDVIERIIQFAQRRRVGVAILSGSGSVTNVTLRHPLSHSPSVCLNGPFHILSLTGSFLGFSSTTFSSPTPSSISTTCGSLASISSFGITLAGAQGQIFGGIVGGKMTAVSQVVVLASTFVNPIFHRLPCEAEEEEEAKPAGIGGGGGNEACASPSGISMSVYNAAAATPLSCHIPPDVMAWGPTSRPPY